MIIGVFDSGIGGAAAATRLRELIPNADVRSINDSANMPYGTKSDDEITALTTAAIQPLLALNPDAIVIACNTATTVAIAQLRSLYPTQRFIGLEPMIKPAARLTHTGVIAVCATPGTFRSRRYQELKDTYASRVQVIEPDCSSWASLIENDEPEKIDVEATVASLIAKDVDVIVLACTHYHWIKERFIAAGPDITILEPTDAIAKRIAELTT